MKAILVQILAIPLLLAFTSTRSSSQVIDLGAPTGCVVADVKGKITYQEKGISAVKPVTNGTVLPDNATVTIGKNASFSFACIDRSLPFSKKGTYQVAALTKEVMAKGEVSKFARMAVAAKGFINPDTTRKKGWGNEDSILFKVPSIGKIPLQPLTFSWSVLNPTATYKLIVYEVNKESPLLAAVTVGTSFTVDPTQLTITLGQTYSAQAISTFNPNIVSKVVRFTFVGANEPKAALASLMKDKDYQKASALKKLLMEAVELESSELNTLANERYQKAIKMNANSALANQMYYAFLDRLNK